MTKPLYLSDLLTGLIAGLALRGVASLPTDIQFDRAVARLVEEDLKLEARRRGLVLQFRVFPHELYGGSVVVWEELYAAAQRGLISLDGRLRLGPTEAPSYFEDLPGAPEMYQALSGKLLQYLQEAA